MTAIEVKLDNKLFGAARPRRDEARLDLSERFGDWPARGSEAGLASRGADIQPMADFPAVFDLAELDGVNGFLINGADAESFSGRSVASAGDVNGDGFADIIVGAPSADSADGKSYVVFGSGDGFAASLDLASLDGVNGFRMDAIDPFSGRSVASAGDVNGDGFDDVIIGADFADPNGPNSGVSYVVFGQAGGFAASLDLASLDGVNGLRLEGAGRGDGSGSSVATAGDVNGDGIDDIIIGAPFANRGSASDAGSSYVVFGEAAGFTESFDLGSLDGSNGFRIDGIDFADNSGSSVASAGDVNGDGFDDIIIGADGADPAGESYVVFGKAGGFTKKLDLSALDGANGFRIDGIDFADGSGLSVASAGDVNGDGFDDIIVGASAADQGGDGDVGESYVVFGTAGGFAASLDLDGLDGTNGFRIVGIDEGDATGYSVASAGDVNGDGFDDIIIGAFRGDPCGDDSAGESYVVFGKAGGFAKKIDLSTLDGVNGFRLDGIDAGDASGRSVASAGDVNGDGFDEIIISADGADEFAGESYVIFGRAPTEAVRRKGSDADQEILGGDFDDTINGAGGDDTLDGGRGADGLAGGRDGADVLKSGAGDDTLIGERGGDTLRGGGGADSFRFGSLDPVDADRIADFSSGVDMIELDGEVFDLAGGALDPDAFVANAAGKAEDAQDRLIYNSTSGKLFYDADGTGAGEAVLLARLSGAPVVTADDFLVI